MSAQETKPVVAAEPAVVEAAPATAAPVADKPAETSEPVKTEEPAKVEEPATTETAAAATAPVEEAKEEDKPAEKTEAKVVEPIYSGALGYKAPGLKHAFRFSKKYFWFGEDAVSVQSLSHYLRGEKTEVAHPTAAWSSQTGKGLLYFVKHADEKATPAGVLNLSETTELAKDGAMAFHFKLHGAKHTFEAANAAERDGWFVALEKAIEEAKAAKEGIVTSDSYKEELAKLGKPATLAAVAAKEGSTPKKSTDATPKAAETEAAPAEGGALAPARPGSTSSSSEDEEKKKKKAVASKSRSVSRGKRTSIFGNFLGKKEKTEEKEDEMKTEETPAAEASNAAPVIPAVEDLPKPAEEPKTEETDVPAIPPVEEKKSEAEKPKPVKRASIFGNFVEKLKSPTTEKKESDAAFAATKEPEVPAEASKVDETPAETPKVEEVSAAPVIPVTDGTTEAPKVEETKPAATTPRKEKTSFSFGKFLSGSKEKVKTPAPTDKVSETAPKVEHSAKAEETAEASAPVAPVEPVTETPKEDQKENEAPTNVTSPTATKAKRGSIFGSAKGLFRAASSAGKPKKEKEVASAPPKVEEAVEPKEENKTENKAEELPKAEEKEETPVVAASADQAAISDVVGDAVTVGQAPKSAPQVSTTA